MAIKVLDGLYAQLFTYKLFYIPHLLYSAFIFIYVLLEPWNTMFNSPTYDVIAALSLQKAAID